MSKSGQEDFLKFVSVVCSVAQEHYLVTVWHVEQKFNQTDRLVCATGTDARPSSVFYLGSS